MRKKISICFFGITRDLEKTFPSIQKNLIYPARKLAEVKIFCHFYDLKVIKNSRSQENEIKIKNNWNLFNADKLISEEPNLIFHNYSLENIMKYGDIFKDDYKSIRNLIHQLFSLKKVYEISKENNSDLTIFARPDLYYWDSFEKNIQDLLNSSKDYIAIPNWQFYRGFNDRFAICTSDYASYIYANRINQINNFLRNTQNYLIPECLLFYSIFQSKAKTSLLDIKASRVRANGKMVSEKFFIKKSNYIKVFISNQKSIILKKFLLFLNKFLFSKRSFLKKGIVVLFKSN